jgi:hypothetical protein
MPFRLWPRWRQRYLQESYLIVIITMSDFAHHVCDTTLIIECLHEARRDAEMMYAMKHLPKFYVAY